MSSLDEENHKRVRRSRKSFLLAGAIQHLSFFTVYLAPLNNWYDQRMFKLLSTFIREEFPAWEIKLL